MKVEANGKTYGARCEWDDLCVNCESYYMREVYPKDEDDFSDDDAYLEYAKEFEEAYLEKEECFDKVIYENKGWLIKNRDTIARYENMMRRSQYKIESFDKVALVRSYYAR